jgi:hypothetical protein
MTYVGKVGKLVKIFNENTSQISDLRTVDYK